MACLSRMLQQLELPLDATGYGEFELQAAGLYGDSLMLGYSTTGQLTGSVRQGVMTLTIRWRPSNNVSEIPELNANFDRGRFTRTYAHYWCIGRRGRFAKGSNTEWRGLRRA